MSQKEQAEIGKSLLSDVIIHSKYARFVPEKQRRETWEEICDRYQGMMSKRFPKLKNDISKALDLVRAKKILPSMRALQFAGKAIEAKHERIYNCSYAPLDSIESFSEGYFLLLAGCGFGYSVQQRHVSKLPTLKTPNGTIYYQIEDSIEGWADSVKMLLKAYLEGGPQPVFDYSKIRAKGSKLSATGGKAPGPEPLKNCLEKIEGLLLGTQIFYEKHTKVEGKLTSFDCHRIMCLIAESVLSGGVRRSSLISLFDKNDNRMLTCKSGEWWKAYPELRMANNSVVLHREETTKEEFDSIFKRIEESNAGEPGIFWTNDYDLGTNPCCEISLRPYTFCNLNEINGSNIENLDDLLNRCQYAALLGTLQASFTDFKYLRPIWKKSTEEDALIGVGITGIASNKIDTAWLAEASYSVKQWNEFYSRNIGINSAARCTTVKPAGTTSSLLGSSSGIHGWHDEYYIRRMRILKTEALYTYLLINNPEILEDDIMDPQNTAIISFPIKATEGGSLRSESMLDLLERIKTYNIEWIHEGHRSGLNYNNVSATVSVPEKSYVTYFNELGTPNYSISHWELLREWMWKNKEFYSGISILPEDLGSYQQTPFESITKEKYEELVKLIKNIDLSKVIEIDDNTDMQGNVACSGGTCDLI